MRLGRESLVLIAVPLLLLGGAFTLLIPSRNSEVDTVRLQSGFEQQAASVEATHTRGSHRSVRNGAGSIDPTSHGSAATETAEAGTGPAAGRASGISTETGATDGNDVADDSRVRRPFRGRVVDESGAPLPGATIVVTERRNLFDKNARSYGEVANHLQVPTDVNGSFEVRRREGFIYVIQVHADGFAPRTVGLNTLATRRTITLTSDAVVSGAVIDATTGQAIRDAVVNLRMYGGGNLPRTERAAADGTFRFDAVAAGNGFLEISHPDYRPDSVFLQDIRPDDVHHRVVKLRPGLTLSGTVVTPAGAPIEAPITVSLFDRYLNVGAGEVNGTGSFSFGAVRPGGQYVVTATAEGLGTTSQVVLVPLTGAVPFVTLTLGDSWTLFGYVNDETGAPLRGVRVVVEPMVSNVTSLPSVGYTDVSGRFEIEDLGEQSYRLVAYLPGYAAEEIGGITRAGYEHEGLQVTLHGGCDLSGTLLNAAGDPVGAAWVRLRVRDAGGRLVGPTLFAYSGPDGTFRFDNAQPGDADVLVLASGFEPATERFVLPSSGAPVHRDIRLLRE